MDVQASNLQRVLRAMLNSYSMLVDYLNYGQILSTTWKQTNAQGDGFQVFLDDTEVVSISSGGLTDRIKPPSSVQVKTCGNLMLLHVNWSKA